MSENIIMFISFDNEEKSYLAGQKVKGTLILECKNEEIIKGIEMRCVGKTLVKLNLSKKAASVAKDRFFDYKIFVAGDGINNTVILPGKSKYSFEYHLPSNSVSSFNPGAFGSTSYKLEAIIKRRALKLDSKMKANFTVNAIVNLNFIPWAKLGGEIRKQKTFSSFFSSNEEISVLVKTPKTSFIREEFIPIISKVTNNSKRVINGITLKLVQKAIFNAESYHSYQDGVYINNERDNKKFVQRVDGTKKYISKKVKLSLDIAKVKKYVNIKQAESDVWEGNLLQVPLLFHNQNVPPSTLEIPNLIQFHYYIKVIVYSSGVSTKLKGKMPVVIGTIPHIGN